MQDSPIAMLQAANLYVFTMNNPIRWIDPSGLSARSAIDGLFSLTQNEIRALGGSFTMNRTGTAIWTITFGNTTFRTDGNFQLGGGSIQCGSTRGGSFVTDTVMRGSSEMVTLGGHSAFGFMPAPHLHISMFITSRSSSWWDSEYFSGNSLLGDTIRFATISGTGELGLTWRLGVGYLTSEVNRRRYFERDNLLFVNHLYSGSGMVQGLFEAHNHFSTYYNRRFGYTANRNSTSVVVGLLNAVGLDHGFTEEQERRALGTNRAIRPRFFGVSR